MAYKRLYKIYTKMNKHNIMIRDVKTCIGIHESVQTYRKTKIIYVSEILITNMIQNI